MMQGGIIHHKSSIDLLVGYKYIVLPYIPLTKMQGSRIHHKPSNKTLECN
jgi:hypothetical protein